MDEGRKDMTDAPEKIWAKEGHDSWGQYGDWYRDNKGGGTEYTRIDVSDARIAELERSRDNWMLMVGKVAAIIPLKDTIGATATLGDMIEYFKGNQARIAELEAALMGYKEEYCELGSDLCGLLSNDSCGGCYAANALQAKT